MNADKAGNNWTAEEINVTVEIYFDMLRMELAGETVNKAKFNRSLQSSIERSRGSIEFKHCNISAVLEQQRSFYIDGYKPRRNVQHSLRTEVERRLASDSELERLMLHSLNRPVSSQNADLILHMSEAPVLEVAEQTYHRRAVKHDFVKLEADKRELGLAGELAVVNFERSRLSAVGCQELANQVEHVSLTQGDGLGFDVLSFDTTGAERLIEVKTTRRAETWPFIATRNEVSLSTEEPDKFYLYRVYGFDRTRPGLFALPGSLEQSCSLVPRVFDAYPV